MKDNWGIVAIAAILALAIGFLIGKEYENRNSNRWEFCTPNGVYRYHHYPQQNSIYREDPNRIQVYPWVDIEKNPRTSDK